jgi:hypothetical protein
MAKKVHDRFELTRDPSTLPLDDIRGNDGAQAIIRGYTGPEVDWMIHSHMENRAAGFVNVHLTIWLGPQVKVPHFGLAMGAFPDPWMFIDSVPRSVLTADTDSYDRYFGPLEQEWQEIQDADWVNQFVSRAGFVRASLSPTAHCFSAKDVDKMIEFGPALAERHLDRWLAWVDEAPAVPAEERAALAATDEATRRNIAERDPANVMGDRLFGEETTGALVRALWGGDRQLPRPCAG